MYIPFKFRPKLFDCMKGYNASQFTADASAGLTVGIIALPMAMAFAIGSNVSPAAGIITAVIAGFLTSFLGGSRVAIGGPTGAFVGIVAGIVSAYGLESLLICTMMAGVILLAMGVARLGGLIRYIPSPLVKGFTTGIAVIILCGQLKDFLGIQADIDSSNIIATISGLLPHLGEISLATLAVSAVSIIGMNLWPKKLSRYVPGSVVMLLLVTGFVALFAENIGLNIETIGSRFGGIPRSLPFPHLPEINFATFQNLLTPALTIALLGAIESLLCATAADSMIDDEHNPDQELMAQGIANIVSPLFGGIPATGAIARTAANIRSGARTPVAGIVHALVLLLIMLLAAPLAKFIPLAVLSAVLIMVAINMGDWREFILLPKYPRSDASVFLVTFTLTIIFGLTQAVSVGMFLACILFIRGMSRQSQVGIQTVNHHHHNHHHQHHHHQHKAGEATDGSSSTEDVLMVNMSGAMFFGAAKKLKNIMSFLNRGSYKVLVLGMGRVVALDATALLTIEEIITKYRSKGVDIILVGLENQPRVALTRAGLLEEIPEANIVADIDTAMMRAEAIIEELEVVVHMDAE